MPRGVTTERLKRLVESPAGCEFIAQVDAEADAERVSKVKAELAGIDELQRRGAEELPALRSARDKFRESRIRAEKLLERERTAESVAEARLLGRSIDLDWEKNRNLRQIIRLTPTEVPEFVREINRRIDDRRLGFASATVPTEIVTEQGRVRRLDSNADRIAEFVARANAIRAAVSAPEFAAHSIEEIRRRIEELRRSLEQERDADAVDAPQTLSV